MNKFKFASCLTALLFSGATFATSSPCNGFEIKIKNKTSDDLLVTKLDLSGADVQPSGLNTIKAHSEQAFTVNNSADGGKMNGQFEFNSVSLPSKKAYIKFDLKNKKLICHHHEKQMQGDYSIKSTRLPGHVKYSIG